MVSSYDLIERMKRYYDGSLHQQNGHHHENCCRYAVHYHDEQSDSCPHDDGVQLNYAK